MSEIHGENAADGSESQAGESAQGDVNLIQQEVEASPQGPQGESSARSNELKGSPDTPGSHDNLFAMMTAQTPGNMPETGPAVAEVTQDSSSTLLGAAQGDPVAVVEPAARDTLAEDEWTLQSQEVEGDRSGNEDMELSPITDHPLHLNELSQLVETDTTGTTVTTGSREDGPFFQSRLDSDRTHYIMEQAYRENLVEHASEVFEAQFRAAHGDPALLQQLVLENVENEETIQTWNEWDTLSNTPLDKLAHFFAEAIGVELGTPRWEGNNIIYPVLS